MWGPLRGARPAPPRSGSPSAGSSGYRGGGGDASANQRPASRRPSRDRFESGSVTRRRIGPSIRDHRERFIGKYASSPRTRRVHTRTTRSNFHRISIEPSTHTRTTIGTSRMRIESPRELSPTPPPESPLRPFPPPTPTSPSPRQTLLPPHERVPPARAAHPSPTSASSMSSRDTRDTFSSARSPAPSATSPRTLAPVVPPRASPRRTSRVRTASDPPRRRRRIDASPPPRVDVLKSPQTHLHLFAPSRGRGERAGSPRDVSRADVPHRRESKDGGAVSAVERERGEVSRDARHLSRRRASVGARVRPRGTRVPGSSESSRSRGSNRSPPRAHAAARVAAWRKGARRGAYERHFRTARGPGHAPSPPRNASRARTKPPPTRNRPSQTPPSGGDTPEGRRVRGSTVVSGAGGGGEDRGAGGGGGEDRGAGGAGGR